MFNLSSLYESMYPAFNLDFPEAKDESDYENQLIEGFHKVLRGFRVLNELCEWSILARKAERLASSNSVAPSYELFEHLAHTMMDDVATVARKLVNFKPDQSVDLMSLFTEITDYLQLYFEAGREWGDFEDRIGGALIHLSMSDPEIEHALYATWILDLNDPAGERSNQFYSYVFEYLDKRLQGDTDESKIMVERVYVGSAIVSIIATDDDVEFIVDSVQEDITKGEWDEDYKFSRIYKNDKRTPNTKEEWLDLMAPAESEGFRLGIRSYKSYEEAIKVERDWVSAISAYLCEKYLDLREEQMG